MTRAALALVLAACASSTGVQHSNLVFDRVTPLARNDEIARRALPPLTYRRIHEALAARHSALAEQSIDLVRERFDVYVPGGPPPPHGWGLVVFISPGDEPTRPWHWRGALDRRGLIFVAAQGSGNTRNVLDRRVPLALLAYANVRARYAIDERRVYLMGLSGGSRVAELTALAYPDVFRGALLDAGADPIDGQAGVYKPPADLFRAFQRTRLVLITGEHDELNLAMDAAALASLHRACVLDATSDIALGLGHESLGPGALDRALDALDRPASTIDAAALARCNAGVERALAAELAAAEAAVARGDRSDARRRLTAIDARFGGLAAPAILTLDDRLGPPALTK